MALSADWGEGGQTAMHECFFFGVLFVFWGVVWFCGSRKVFKGGTQNRTHDFFLLLLFVCCFVSSVKEPGQDDKQDLSCDFLGAVLCCFVL